MLSNPWVREKLWYLPREYTQSIPISCVVFSNCKIYTVGIWLGQ